MEKILNDEYPKKMNMYYGIVGFFDFLNNMLEKIKSSNIDFLGDTELTLVRYKEKEIDQYIQKRNRTMVKEKIDNYNYGFVLCENYISELGNRLLELNDDIDIVIMINVADRKISLRSNDDVDCSIIAKEWYGGGGHEQASGAELSEDVHATILNILFKAQL